MNYRFPIAHAQDGTVMVRREILIGASKRQEQIEGRWHRVILWMPAGSVLGVAADERGQIKAFGLGEATDESVWQSKLVRLSDGHLVFLPLGKKIGTPVYEHELGGFVLPGNGEYLSSRLVDAYEMHTKTRGLVKEFLKRAPLSDGPLIEGCGIC